VGVEAIISSAGDINAKPNYNFAFIKGFQRAGVAISSNSDNTFYSYNLTQGYIGTPNRIGFEQTLTQYSETPMLNIGGALALVQDSLQKYMTPTFGLNARYNKLSHAWDYGIGTSMNSEYLTVGLSSIRSRGEHSVGYPETTTTTGNFGLKLSKLNFEYTILYYRTSDPTVMTLPIYNDPVQIATASLQLKSFIGSCAYRTATNIMARGLIFCLWLFNIK